MEEQTTMLPTQKWQLEKMEGTMVAIVGHRSRKPDIVYGYSDDTLTSHAIVYYRPHVADGDWDANRGCERRWHQITRWSGRMWILKDWTRSCVGSIGIIYLTKYHTQSTVRVSIWCLRHWSETLALLYICLDHKFKAGSSHLYEFSFD